MHVAYLTYKDGSVQLGSNLVVVADTALIHEVVDAICAKFQLPGGVLLWKPKWHLQTKGHEDLRNRLDSANGNLDQICEELSDVERSLAPIASVFTPTPSPTLRHEAKNTALIIEIPKALPVKHSQDSKLKGNVEDDTVTELRKSFEKVFKHTETSTPSVSSQPRNYKKHQGGDVPILDGRYDTLPTPAAVPIEVFHPAFAHFLALARDNTLQPPDEVVRLTADFIHSTSQIVVAQSARQMTTRGMLSKLLGCPAIQTVQLNKSSAEHIVPYNCGGEVFGTAALVIIEEKSELDISGEGSIQGSFSFIQHWNDQRDLARACFCPSFIVSVAGPWLVVLGAIITSHAIVHRLTDYIWLGGGRAMDDARTLVIARILHGLRQAIGSLADFYANLSGLVDDAARFCPLATSCTVNENGEMKTITWRYIRPLKGPDPSCVTFLAVNCEDEDQDLVVKFVERYGELAHKELVAVHRAPELLYCGDVWAGTPERRGCGLRKMVVMKYVRGETIGKKYQSGRVPESVRKVVHEAVKFLHQKQLVHGDIRCPNIIIEDGEGEEDKRVKLLDFDWSGSVGEVRYPLHLSNEIAWPKGAEDYMPILPDHDLEMVNRL